MNKSNPVAKILALLFSGHRKRLIDQLAGEAARDCRGQLWRGICRQIRSMTPSEIRGYARALAAGLIEETVEHVLERWNADTSLRDQVVASGIEQLMVMAVRDALSDPFVDEERLAA